MIMMAEPTPAFREGDVVRHRRYGYRAVVVSVDLTCKADDSWYQANLTQPNRKQPWYHVLVDGDGSVRYAAQTSLQADGTGLPIAHPLLPAFFSEFEDGAYQRNDNPWPG